MSTENLKGADELIAKLKRISNPETRKKIMKYIAGKLESHTRKGFAKQVDPSGKKWAAVKKIKKGRDGKKKNKKILTQTGAMASGIRSAYTDTMAQWGIAAVTPYAKYHQYGTRKMPERKIIADDIKEMPEKIDQFIAKQLERA